jgi:hypothetical protein
MPRRSKMFFVYPVFAVLSLQMLGAQDRSPQIVLDLEKPSSELRRFGVSCEHFKQHPGGERELGDNSPSIAELFGAPIEVVRIRRYSKNRNRADDVKKHVAEVLRMHPWPALFGSVPWQEGVLADIVATVRFTDHTEATFEESSGHVCFSDHSGSALWTRAVVR